MVLVIDNYDSFVYNLVQYLGELGEECRVFRNDALDLKDVENISPDFILISPGPCSPNEAGISLSLVKKFSGKIPILGVCLGHQVIGQAFGGRVVKAPYPVHGKTSLIYHSGKGVLSGIPSPFEATRYHSLVVEKESLPGELEVTAWSSDNLVMALSHKEHLTEGVQFHPESILTPYGKKILANFLKMVKEGGEKIAG
jgi:anthranilate synthase/aminodeoxychorismate synthase-like glutamine amidotransferase